MTLVEELDEALDTGHGETVLVTREFLGRLHRAVARMEQRRTVLAVVDAMGIPLEALIKSEGSSSSGIAGG